MSQNNKKDFHQQDILQLKANLKYNALYSNIKHILNSKQTSIRINN